MALLVLAELRRKTGRPLVVVAPDARRAEELSLALRFFEGTEGELDPVPVVDSLSHSPFSGLSPPLSSSESAPTEPTHSRLAKRAAITATPTLRALQPVLALLICSPSV